MKKIYINTLVLKNNDVLHFLDDISTDKDHIFWDYTIDLASETIENFNFDVAGIAKEVMRKKIQKWKFLALLDKGSLSTVIYNYEATINWLFNRYISEYRNLFDKRSKNHLNIHNINQNIYNKYFREIDI